jgi:arginine repressor
MSAGVTGCKCSKNTVVKEEVKSSSEQLVQQPQLPHSDFEQNNNASISRALPSVIIYKTKADYSKNVPVGLNEERTAIVSYPGKTDIKGQEPTPLKYGFLLDRRGVNTNVAFLKYTYEEYLNLETIPPIAELFKAVLDADPLTEMYNCGKKSDFPNGDVEDQLNQALTENNGNPEKIYKKLK